MELFATSRVLFRRALKASLVVGLLIIVLLEMMV
jgi:hypothetical protein